MKKSSESIKTANYWCTGLAQNTLACGISSNSYVMHNIALSRRNLVASGTKNCFSKLTINVPMSNVWVENLDVTVSSTPVAFHDLRWLPTI